MDVNKFLSDFIDLYDDSPSAVLTLNSKFREIEGWSSFVGLSIIAMVDEKYKVRITADELRNSNTIEDLFRLIANK